jgi:chromosome segregation ATPase
MLFAETAAVDTAWGAVIIAVAAAAGAAWKAYTDGKFSKRLAEAEAAHKQCTAEQESARAERESARADREAMKAQLAECREQHQASEADRTRLWERLAAVLMRLGGVEDDAAAAKLPTAEKKTHDPR